MRSFVFACIAAAAIAAISAVVLEQFQEPVTVAFSTNSARP
jgi:hypothetical protein